MSIKTEKKPKFSETPVVKNFLDGLGGNDKVESISDRMLKDFNELTTTEQTIVLKLINKLKKKKIMLDKQAE